MAELKTIVTQLRAMDNARVCGLILAQVAKTIPPLKPAVAASLAAIPVKGEVPYHQPPGLRLRIAGCVESWAKTDGVIVTAGVAVDAGKMPPGQMSLPLGMEGAKRWRHPVFGRRANPNDWVTQAPHPYFYQAVSWFGGAAESAVERALNDITGQISG